MPVTGGCTSCNSSTTTSYNVGISLNVDDPLVIKKVEFYINGKYAGETTQPPFISDTISVATSTGTVLGKAVIYDTNGNISTVSKTEKVQGICN